MKCRQYSEAEKQSYVAEFKNSGQKINAFAKDNNIPVTTSIASLERMFRFIFHPRRLEDIE